MKRVGAWLCLISFLSSAWASSAVGVSRAATAQSPSSAEVVVDTSGQLLRYGSSNTFNIKLYNESTYLLYGFYFGLGGADGDVVRTDTELSLGVSGPTSLLQCQNGTAVSGFQGTTPPDDGLFVVRYNSTPGFYYLQLSKSPSTGIVFNTSHPLFLCTPGVPSTPIEFHYDIRPPSSSTNSLLPFLPLIYFLVSLSLFLSSPLLF